MMKLYIMINIESLPNEILLMIVNNIGVCRKKCKSPLHYIFNLLLVSRRFLFLQNMRYIFDKNASNIRFASQSANYISVKLNGLKDGPEYIFDENNVDELIGYGYLKNGKLLNNHLYSKDEQYFYHWPILFNFVPYSNIFVCKEKYSRYSNLYDDVFENLLHQIEKKDPHIIKFAKQSTYTSLLVRFKRLQETYDINFKEQYDKISALTIKHPTWLYKLDQVWILFQSCK